MNGDFTNGMTNWGTSGVGWGVIDSVADLFTIAGQGYSRLSQWNVFVLGKDYRITFDANVVSGYAHMSDLFSGTDILIDYTGSYDLIFTANNSTTLRIIADGSVNADLTIDNISVVELDYNNTPNTDDTYGSCSECILGVLIR